MRRIVRTTRRTQVDDGNGEPVEAMRERRVVRLVPEEEDMRSNDETRALRPWMRGLQNATQRQFALLRDMDFRVTNSEERSRVASDEAALGRTTFWVVWVTLMLVLSAALAIVLVFILMPIVR